MNRRFTLDGSEELESHLAETCGRVVEEVGRVIPQGRLEAIVLAGGYGRGEGGVLRTAQGDRPYNDLEFYVFIKGNRFLNDHLYANELRCLAERLSPAAGLHVEFKADSISRLRRSSPSLFAYDLVSAHQVLLGQPSLFTGCERHLDPTAIPLREASRLLLNRCSGLLLAGEILASNERGAASAGTNLAPLTPDQADFVGRNLAKAQLALGDALLVAFGLHHWSCRKRGERLKHLEVTDELPWFDAVRSHHAEGVQFKLHPRCILKSRTDFQRERRALCELASGVWLWLENRRLGSSFSSMVEYALDQHSKYPGLAAWRNYLLTVRTFGLKESLRSFTWRYPRERLLNALPLLLWHEDFAQRPELVQHLQRQLATPAVEWAGFVAAYKQLWPQYG